MVLENIEEKNFFQIYQILLKKYLKNIRYLVMWPNKNNYSNFGLENKKILKKEILFIQILLVLITT